MKLSIPAGTTSKRIAIFIQDSSSTTGAGLTGLVFNTSSLVCYSWIDTDGNAGGTSQTLQTATLGTWTTRGFKEKDATNMPGMYEFGVPDALLAAGVKWAAIMFKGATNMAPCVLEIEVTAVSNQDAVRGGMTALPNANAEAAGGLYTRGTGAGQIKQTNNGEIDSNVTHINNVATTSVTTIAAIQGTTVAPTFTSSLVKVDVTDWAAAAVAAVNVSGIPVVDVTKWNGSSVFATSSGIPDVNVKNMNNVSGAGITTVKAVQGLTTADTIAQVTGNVAGNVMGSVGSVTGLTVTNLDAMVSSRAAAGDAMALTAGERSSTADAILARSLAAESYAADGAVPTISQALYLIQQTIGDFSINGTTLTVRKLDGAATAAVYTLDSATTPTSRTRTT